MKLLSTAFGVIILVLAGGTYYLYDAGKSTNEELQAIKSGYLEMDKQTETLKKENSDLVTELEAARKQYDKLQGHLDRVSENSEQSSDQLSGLRIKNEELQQQIAQLEQDKKTIAAKLESKAAELVTKEEELTAKLAAPVEAAKAEVKQEANRFQALHNRLSGKMAKEIGNKLATISTSTKQLSISLAEKSLFDSGRAEITLKGSDLLDKLGKIIKENKGANISVAGHHDSKDLGFFIRANYATPWELTSARATAVTRYLNEKNGISGKRLSAVGMSKYHPVASNKSDKGRSQNRRIVITLSHD